MAIETADYISQLNAASPAGADSRAEGDDHIRLIKAVLKSTFPALDGAVNRTAAQLNKAPYDLDSLLELVGAGVPTNGGVPGCVTPPPPIAFGWHVTTKRLRALVGGSVQTGGIITEADFTGGKQKKTLPGYQEFPGNFCIEGGTFSQATSGGVQVTKTITLQRPFTNILFAFAAYSSGVIGGTITVGANNTDSVQAIDVSILTESSGTRTYRYFVMGFLA